MEVINTNFAGIQSYSVIKDECDLIMRIHEYILDLSNDNKYNFYCSFPATTDLDPRWVPKDVKIELEGVTKKIEYVFSKNFKPSTRFSYSKYNEYSFKYFALDHTLKFINMTVDNSLRIAAYYQAQATPDGDFEIQDFYKNLFLAIKRSQRGEDRDLLPEYDALEKKDIKEVAELAVTEIIVAGLQNERCDSSEFADRLQTFPSKFREILIDRLIDNIDLVVKILKENRKEFTLDILNAGKPPRGFSFKTKLSHPQFGDDATRNLHTKLSAKLYFLKETSENPDLDPWVFSLSYQGGEPVIERLDHVNSKEDYENYKKLIFNVCDDDIDEDEALAVWLNSLT